MATPRHSIELTAEERHRLEEVARQATASRREVRRARLALLAAQGRGNHEIARTLHCALQTVKTWRARLAKDRLGALKDRARSGRPRTFGARAHAQVKAVACQLPAERGLPLSRFSISEIHEEVRKENLHPLPSRTTVWRILHEDGLRSWTYRTWIHKRAPDFLEKAGPILDLYEGVWQGRPLGPGDRVVCADEKTGIQLLSRQHPTRPPRSGEPGRVEFEYRRKGTITFVGALDVRSGKVFGAFPESNNAGAFRQFVGEVMAQEPLASASRVFWVMDNGSAHHPKSFGPWLQATFPQAQVLHTPVHASWVDQEEIFLSILTRKALTPRDFRSKEEARARIRGFLARWNRHRHPFRWRYTRADLAEDLKQWEEEDKNRGPSPPEGGPRCRGRKEASPKASRER